MFFYLYTVEKVVITEQTVIVFPIGKFVLICR